MLTIKYIINHMMIIKVISTIVFPFKSEKNTSCFSLSHAKNHCLRERNRRMFLAPSDTPRGYWGHGTCLNFETRPVQCGGLLFSVLSLVGWPSYQNYTGITKSIPVCMPLSLFCRYRPVVYHFVVVVLYGVVVSFMLFVQPFRFERCPEWL